MGAEAPAFMERDVALKVIGRRGSSVKLHRHLTAKPVFAASQTPSLPLHFAVKTGIVPGPPHLIL